MRVIALAAVLLLLGVAASWGSAGAVAGSATLKRAPTLSHVKTRWRTTVAKLPANAFTDAVNESVSIASISCASPGNCTAVGSYMSKGYDTEGLLLTEKAGHWARGVEAVLPANADSSPAIVSLNSVSCASAGSCTAVGTYETSAGIYDEDAGGLLLTEKAGHWARGVEAALPADGGSRVDLNSVSCASAGNCTAVGCYDCDDQGSEGLLLTEKAGHWERGVAWGLEGAVLESVSCASDGSCSAVGYDDWNLSDDRRDGLLLTKQGGTWRRVDVVWPDGGPGEGAVLTSVSCASAGNCSATGLEHIGVYEEGRLGVLLTEKAGTWGPGVTAEPPTTDPVAISCASRGNCVAVDNSSRGLTLLTEEAGKWRRGVKPALPRGAHHPAGNAVSCASPGNCTVVGFDGYGSNGLLLTEIAGRWARGVTAIPPFYTSEIIVSVSCPSPGNCGAVGGEGGSYDGDGILLDSTTEPCVVPKVEGKTLRRARHSIESHNCVVGTIERPQSRTIEIGHVISQTPRPGRHFAPGTKVNVEVSSGP